MECVYIKKGEENTRKVVNGKTFRLLQRSKDMESIIAELEVGVESERYCHEGEEFHLMLKGVMEYTVDDKTYRLEEGDSLWHHSDIPHSAKNIGNGPAIYLTVSSPSTFM